MQDLWQAFGVGSLSGFCGGIVSFLSAKLIDHRLQVVRENHKHDLSTIANRLSYLHQERGKAAIDIVRAVKKAKMHLREFLHPAQLQHVDLGQAWQESKNSCTELHNLIAEKSFVFSVELESRLLVLRNEMWSLIDDASILFSDAQKRDLDVRSNAQFSQLWKRYDTVLGPLEKTLVTEIRSLLDPETGVNRR